MQSSTGSIIILLIFLIVSIVTISIIIYYSSITYNNQTEDDIETIQVNIGENVDEYLKYTTIKDHHSSENNDNHGVIKYQEFEDDVVIRGKSVYDFMSKSSQKIMKVSKKQVIPNEIRSGSLIQIDGNDNHMIELPDVLNEGLCLTFFNNSHVKQTINSSSPITITGSISLTISIPNDSILTLISNGSQWITLYQSYVPPTTTSLPVTTTSSPVTTTSSPVTTTSSPVTTTTVTPAVTSTVEPTSKIQSTLNDFISTKTSIVSNELDSIEFTLDNLLHSF